jgi:hypothetical protein
MEIKLAPMIGADGFCEWLRELGHIAEVQKCSASDPLTYPRLCHQVDGLDRETSCKFVSHLLVQYHEDPFGASTEVASGIHWRHALHSVTNDLKLCKASAMSVGASELRDILDALPHESRSKRQ